jgi:hypothetical protein
LIFLKILFYNLKTFFIYLNDMLKNPTHVLTWEKPSANWLKCNVDGPIFMTEGKFGVGICFRDSMSSFVQAHTKISPFVVTAAECEATAMKHALKPACLLT